MAQTLLRPSLGRFRVLRNQCNNNDERILFNGENMSVTAGDYFSAETISNTSADVSFTFGEGAAANPEVSAIDSKGGFNITGASLATGNITIADLSARVIYP